MIKLAPPNEKESLVEPLLSEEVNTAQQDEQEERLLLIVDSENDAPSKEEDSLAWNSSLFIRILIPLLTLVTHLLFIYGQTEPMWRLTTTSQYDVWANATSFPTKVAFDTLGMNHTHHFQQEHQERDIQTFTYAFAIRELWKAHGMPGSKCLPRLAAILLTLVSGIWPHLKLLLLEFSFFKTMSPLHRKSTLCWLSSLGKWSLADVLVVCVMVGVLSLDYTILPHAILAGVQDNLPLLLHLLSEMYNSTMLCEEVLHMTCNPLPTSLRSKLKCETCQRAITAALSHPDWSSSQEVMILQGIATSGGGAAQMKVVGMRGIYAFCVAVICSILLSILVDVIHHARQAEEQGKRRRDDNDEYNAYMALSDCLDVEEPLILETDDNAPALQSHLQLEQGTDNDDNDNTYSNNTVQQPLFRITVRMVVALIVVVLVILAITMATMERRVNGAIPTLLHDILGMTWTKPYSLWTLAQTTGAAGGWDLLLMGTFSLFIVVGPLLRAILCLLSATRSTWIVDFIGAFCAWEVFIVAIVMVDLLMPAITSTVIMDERCAEVSSDGTCLEVEFNLLRSFWVILVGGFLLLVVPNVGRNKQETGESKA